MTQHHLKNFKPLSEVVAKKTSRTFAQVYQEESTRLRIAHELRALREFHGLTQTQLAKKVLMPQSVIARIESGEHACTLGTLDRIAFAFNKKIQLR